jgi:hypothetical protein
MDEPPHSGTDSSAEQARDGDREQHLRSEDSEAEPEGSVCARERDHGVDRPDPREGIEHRGRDVRQQQDDREEREVAMERRDDETR